MKSEKFSLCDFGDGFLISSEDQYHFVIGYEGVSNLVELGE